MIITLFTWLMLLLAAIITGSFLVSLSSCARLHTIDLSIAVGLAALTVYAQAFSLFYHVGALAFLGMFLLCLLFLVILIRRGVQLRSFLRTSAKADKKLAFAILVVIAFAFAAAQEPNAYDTSLYHAQAIRWIEEYGVVPGLGNLHNRFAYNSSFLCLQALFDFRWLFGQSLHSVNGLLSALAVCYAVLTQSGEKKALLSDFLKLTSLFYLYEQRGQISSPNTDLSALLMLWYILVKWTEMAEKMQTDTDTDTAPWCVLCILSVYAMTLKLSCALIVLLTVYPLVLMIERREVQRLIASLLAGIVCVLPWMARSVLISGYLIYPLYQLDFFPVDWKIPASVLAYDSREISVWGRAVKEVSLYDEPLSSWLPVWYGSLGAVDKAAVITGFAGLILGVFWAVRGWARRRLPHAMVCSLLVCAACTLMWFFSSPDLRYGRIYVLLWNCFLLYWIFGRVGRFVLPLLAVPVLSVLLGTVLVHDAGIWVSEADYPHFQVTGVDYENETFYIPSSGDQTGYEYFPSTPYPKRLEQIELRGEDLSEGFRVKEQYRAGHWNAYGEEW